MSGFNIENMILVISMCIICSLSIRLTRVERTYNYIIQEIKKLKERLDALENSHGESEDGDHSEEEHRKKINEIFDRMKGAV